MNVKVKTKTLQHCCCRIHIHIVLKKRRWKFALGHIEIHESCDSNAGDLKPGSWGRKEEGKT
jgi:hypothetical protein